MKYIFRGRTESKLEDGILALPKESNFYLPNRRYAIKEEYTSGYHHLTVYPLTNIKDVIKNRLMEFSIIKNLFHQEQNLEIVFTSSGHLIIRIPESFLQHTGLGSNDLVTLLGSLTSFELWKPENLTTYILSMTEEELNEVVVLADLLSSKNKDAIKKGLEIDFNGRSYRELQIIIRKPK